MSKRSSSASQDLKDPHDIALGCDNSKEASLDILSMVIWQTSEVLKVAERHQIGAKDFSIGYHHSPSSELQMNYACMISSLASARGLSQLMLPGHDFHVSTFVDGTLAWACSMKMSCSDRRHRTAHRRFGDAPGCSQAAKGPLLRGSNSGLP